MSPRPIGPVALAAVLLLAALTPASAQTPAGPAGKIAVSFHVTLAPSWFDPSTAPPQITPFGVLYAIHAALVRPLPGQKMAPSLAESWTESADGLFLQQARERDRAKREALLHRIQQITIDRVMFAPVMDLRGLIGVGPRVAEHTVNSIPMFPFPSYEDMRLKTP